MGKLSCLLPLNTISDHFFYLFFIKINNMSDFSMRPETVLYSVVDIGKRSCALLKWACARLRGPRTSVSSSVSSSFVLIPVAIFPSVRLNAFGGGGWPWQGIEGKLAATPLQHQPRGARKRCQITHTVPHICALKYAAEEVPEAEVKESKVKSKP